MKLIDVNNKEALAAANRESAERFAARFTTWAEKRNEQRRAFLQSQELLRKELIQNDD